MTIYEQLTADFNRGRPRAVLAGGQAVVLHRLAIMSKDGDWVLREDGETTDHVLQCLAHRGARYRFGAPLDIRWLVGGWSSHFEFRHDGLRVRTDFFTRPPRMATADLDRLWREQECRPTPVPFASVRDLAEMKKTDREKDYAVIGELARRAESEDDALLLSRSARDLQDLARRFPDRVAALRDRRPVLNSIPRGRDAIESALDAERRALMRSNEERLARYANAAARWAEAWPALDARVAQIPLIEAHAAIVKTADGLLPPRLETIPS